MTKGEARVLVEAGVIKGVRFRYVLGAWVLELLTPTGWQTFEAKRGHVRRFAKIETAVGTVQALGMRCDVLEVGR